MNEKKERKKSYSRAGDIGEKNRSEVTPGDHYHRDAQHLLMLYWLLLLLILLLLLLSFFSIQLSTEKRVHYYSFRSHYFVFRHFAILRNNADDSYWSEIRRSPPSARLPCYKMCRPASQWCHHRSNHLFFTMVNTTIYSCSIITTMNIYIYKFTLLYHLEKIVAIYV